MSLAMIRRLTAEQRLRVLGCQAHAKDCAADSLGNSIQERDGGLWSPHARVLETVRCDLLGCLRVRELVENREAGLHWCLSR